MIGFFAFWITASDTRSAFPAEHTRQFCCASCFFFHVSNQKTFQFLIFFSICYNIRTEKLTHYEKNKIKNIRENMRDQTYKDIQRLTPPATTKSNCTRTHSLRHKTHTPSHTTCDDEKYKSKQCSEQMRTCYAHENQTNSTPKSCAHNHSHSLAFVFISIDSLSSVRNTPTETTTGDNRK